MSREKEMSIRFDNVGGPMLLLGLVFFGFYAVWALLGGLLGLKVGDILIGLGLFFAGYFLGRGKK